MAEHSIKLEVVTPLKEAVSTTVDSVTAPSVKGEFGVLPGHRPLLAALDFGRVLYEVSGQRHEAAVGPGFAEVGPDQVTLLVEHWVPAASIDADEMRDELARAEDRLKELMGQETTAEFKQAQREEKWASVRLEVATRHREN
jgi:F-type H+-transporting ATPase subunit epsilon